LETKRKRMGFVISLIPWWAELFIFLIGSITGFILVFTPKKKPNHKSENYFHNPQTNKEVPFPSVFDEPTVNLSFILPSYNEEQRLPKTLDHKLKYLEGRKQRDPKFTYEIIVVCDGSQDSTSRVALDYSKKFGTDKVRLLKLAVNRGKGGAVTQGILRARGEKIIFADADGATAVEDVEKLEKSLESIQKNGVGLAVGSRHHLVKTEAVVKRSFIRNFLMVSFHLLVYILGVKHINDTQCGFKLFTRKAAQMIFPSMHVEGWIFDIELLLIAEMLHIPSTEVGVNWTEIEGSKVSLLKDSITMLKDLVIIRLNYTLGLWTIKHKSS